MSQYGSIIKGLEASRRLGSQLDLEQHKQELERNKLTKELDQLNKSRRNFVESQINQSHKLYEQKLKQNIDISQEHLGRVKRSQAQKARVAQMDFERQRQRLIRQRNMHDDLDREHRIVQKAILDLKAKSRYASQDQDRHVRQLNSRKQSLLKLLDESKQRQLYHYNQSKNLSSL